MPKTLPKDWPDESLALVHHNGTSWSYPSSIDYKLGSAFIHYAMAPDRTEAIRLGREFEKANHVWFVVCAQKRVLEIDERPLAAKVAFSVERRLVALEKSIAPFHRVRKLGSLVALTVIPALLAAAFTALFTASPEAANPPSRADAITTKALQPR